MASAGQRRVGGGWHDQHGRPLSAASALCGPWQQAAEGSADIVHHHRLMFLAVQLPASAGQLQEHSPRLRCCWPAALGSCMGIPELSFPASARWSKDKLTRAIAGALIVLLYCLLLLPLGGD